MRLKVPEYFHRFSCLAGECRDSCCVGWEIDIDPITLEKFNTVPGIDGKMLLESVDLTGETPCFCTTGDRCVHLRSDGLCELICRHGDEILPDICREHPRYYTTLGDVTYGGVGMTCEAACELILTERGEHRYTVTEGFDAEYEDCDSEIADAVMKLLSELVDILGKSELPLCERVRDASVRVLKLAENIDGADYSALFSYLGCPTADNTGRLAAGGSHNSLSANGANDTGSCGNDALAMPFDPSAVLDMLSHLEYMENSLCELYETVKCDSDGGCVANTGDFDPYLTNVLLYFLDRYMPVAASDGDLLGTLALALISVFILSHAFSRTDGTLTSLVDAAKLWSSEIEYCEENVDVIRSSAIDILPTLIWLIMNTK